MTYCLDDIPGARFALGADHGRPFSDPSERLSEVAASANERDFESVLIDMKAVVRRGKDLGLVDEINLKSLEDSSLYEMPDSAFGHHWNRYSSTGSP